MKKLLIMFFGLAVLTSCSSDDDNIGEDPILGTWVLIEINPAAVNIEDCDETSIIIFGADNTANSTFYLEDSNCEPEAFTGQWENKGNSVYSVDFPVIGEQEGVVNFEGSNNFTFVSQQGISFSFEKQ